MQRYSGEARKRLGAAVREARLASGFDSAAALGDAVGRSGRQILALERGEALGAETTRRVEIALGWVRGTAERIMRGENPPSPAPAQAAELSDDELIAELARRLRRAREESDDERPTTIRPRELKPRVTRPLSVDYSRHAADAEQSSAERVADHPE